MTDLKRAAAALGRKGGKAKVPKGFSMKTKAERSEAARKRLAKRWGKRAVIELTLIYSKDAEEKILAEVKKAHPHFDPKGDCVQALKWLVDRSNEKLYEAIGIRFAEVDGWEKDIDLDNHRRKVSKELQKIGQEISKGRPLHS
jgi:hypothetical protein